MWHAHVPFAEAGSDYAFRVDGGEPVPDPRSPWQPRGPNGPSRVLNHANFPWTDVESSRLVAMGANDSLLASPPRVEAAPEGVLLPPDSAAILASPEAR